jgi:hypothetical protein
MKATQTSFDVECLKLVEERKQIKVQCLQNQSQINVDNLKKFEHETSRYLRKKKREEFKDKRLGTYGHAKNISDFYVVINQCKKHYCRESSLAKGDTRGMPAVSSSILYR